jgi:hypothetical protein
MKQSGRGRRFLQAQQHARCLTPLILLLEGILPSREGTRVDELPQIALFVGLVASR